MFQSLSNRFSQIFQRFSQKPTHFDAHTLKEALTQIEAALIEADCSIAAITALLHTLETEVTGVAIQKGVTPVQDFVQRVHQRLITWLGQTEKPLLLGGAVPAVILMVGLQGAGKTTTVSKLARRLRDAGKRVSVVSCDVYRPAAIDQLQILSHALGVHCHESAASESPSVIVARALQSAQHRADQVLIVDTAGRLHVDPAMLDELQGLHRQLAPVSTLLVFNGALGQDAARSAAAFSACVPLTGIVVTMLDGDARGGAMLTVRHTLPEVPIQFIGVGEKSDALEVFHPDRMAGRILGMGDLQSLAEVAQQQIGSEAMGAAQARLEQGLFNFEDMLTQLSALGKMGGLQKVLGLIPGMGAMMPAMQKPGAEKGFKAFVALIQSMRPEERRQPKLLIGRRRFRVLKGSGRKAAELEALMKFLEQSRTMLKTLRQKGGLSAMMAQFQQGGGNFRQ